MAAETKLEAIQRLASRGWVSLPQVARIMGVAYKTVLSYKNKGTLRPVLVGGKYRVYTDELVRFLTQGNFVNDGTIERIMQEEIHQ